MSEIFPTISTNSSNMDTRSRFNDDTYRSQSGSDIENNQITESFSSVVVSFTVYKLLNELIKPFNSLPAFRVGAIDSEGNYKTDIDNMSDSQRQVLTPFNRLVIGIKRLIRTTSSPKLKADYSYIQTAARAMAFECAELGGDSSLFLEELQKSLDVLCEDGEIGNVVGGGISGGPQVGTANPALAGIDPPLNLSLKKRLLRRKNVIPES